MAKTVTKAKRRSAKKSVAPASKKTPARKSSKSVKRTPARVSRPASKEPVTAAEVLTGLLESPLVADILAAGAAAALASFTHHSLSKRSEGGSKQALKNAAKAAGTAITTRITAEFDEIVKAAKESKRGAR